MTRRAQQKIYISAPPKTSLVPFEIAARNYIGAVQRTDSCVCVCRSDSIDGPTRIFIFDYLVAVINEKVKQDDHFSIKSASRSLLRGNKLLDVPLQHQVTSFMSFLLFLLALARSLTHSLSLSLSSCLYCAWNGYQFYHCYFRMNHE
jgi:hypothetical protein